MTEDQKEAAQERPPDAARSAGFSDRVQQDAFRQENRGADRRGFIKSIGCGLGGVLLSAHGFLGHENARADDDPGRRAVDDNLITRENSKGGDYGWAPDNVRSTHRIEGYTTKDSVAPGETLEFCVSSASSRYAIDCYRLGWYEGAGGRKVKTLEGTEGTKRPVPEPEGEWELVECDWPVTDTVTVPVDWTTGLYYALFKSGKEATACPFVVREETPSATMLVQLPFNTQQAYNGWGGRSFYGFKSDDGEYHKAVSYNRPYENPYAMHIGYAIHFLRWLEREGYSAAYATNLDMLRRPDALKAYTLVACVGHDEYPPPEQYGAYEAARDSGTNLMFIGGNLWTTKTPYRERDRTIIKDGGWHEARVTGLEFGPGTSLWKLADLTVMDTSHRWFEGTGFAEGDEVVGVVGHEWDKLVSESPDNARVLFHYEKGTQKHPISVDEDADAIVYEAASGATVFNCGVLGWPYRLDPDLSWGENQWPLSRLKDYKPVVKKPDPKLQAFQKNVMDDLTAES